MTVAIHQPNYFPWVGYFYKIKAADIFIFLDDVDFSKGSYTNRCRIRSWAEPSQMQWLTQPIVGGGSGTRIKRPYDLRT